MTRQTPECAAHLHTLIVDFCVSSLEFGILVDPCFGRCYDSKSQQAYRKILVTPLKPYLFECHPALAGWCRHHARPTHARLRRDEKKSYELHILYILYGWCVDSMPQALQFDLGGGKPMVSGPHMVEAPHSFTFSPGRRVRILGGWAPRMGHVCGEKNMVILCLLRIGLV